MSVNGDLGHLRDHPQGGTPRRAGLHARRRGDDQTQLANLWSYERHNNPDGTRTYGIIGL